MCFVVCCDYGCYVITITYLVSAVTDFLEYHLTEITEKLFSAKLILKDRYTPYQNVESDTRYYKRFILYEIKTKRDT
jgi:hypothetical protein